MRKDRPAIPELRQLAHVDQAIVGLAAVELELVELDVYQAMRAAELRQAEREEARNRCPVLARWRCTSCSAFVAGEHVDCRRCRQRGPHVYGEQAPTGGNQRRRERLRRERRARRRARVR